MIENVAMVYRSGGDYDLEYVRRLARSIRKFSNDNVKIHCISDIKDVQTICRYIPFSTDYKGWWSKLELFNHFDNCLYFDLDTVIRGDISPLLQHNYSRFTMLEDFYSKGCPASGIMAWKGDYSHIPVGFENKYDGDYRRSGKWGDQGWITERVENPNFFQNLFPNKIASYKLNYNTADIICFHGKPRPRDVGWKV